MSNTNTVAPPASPFTDVPPERGGITGPAQLAARAARHQGAADGLAHAAGALRAACAQYQATAAQKPGHRGAVAVLTAVLLPLAESLEAAAEGERAKAQALAEQVAKLTVPQRRSPLSRSPF